MPGPLPECAATCHPVDHRHGVMHCSRSHSRRDAACYLPVSLHKLQSARRDACMLLSARNAECAACAPWTRVHCSPHAGHPHTLYGYWPQGCQRREGRQRLDGSIHAAQLQGRAETQVPLGWRRLPAAACAYQATASVWQRGKGSLQTGAIASQAAAGRARGVWWEPTRSTATAGWVFGQRSGLEMLGPANLHTRAGKGA